MPRTPTDGRHPPRGAYGLAVSGLDIDDRLLPAAEPSWPAVRIRIERRSADAGGVHLDEGHARYPHADGGHVVVDRRTGVVSFRGADVPLTDEIVHPHLGMLGAVYAQWLPGRMAFHAGAFISGEGAWAVVGERQDGKSTLMAAIAAAGMPVVGDDTLVVDGMRCLSGVRCIDLRPDAASGLGIRHTQTARRGGRERLLLERPAQEAPLRGWLFLNWGD